MTYRGLTGEFDLFASGGGELGFTGISFNLPLRATEPVVFRSPFTMQGSLRLAESPLGGDLAGVVFELSGSGVATATFVPGQLSALGQEFFFETESLEFSDAVPTPEPGTLLLFSVGFVSFARRRLLAARA